MKTLLLTFFSLLSLSASAADFTISLQPAGGPKEKLFFYKKSDNSKLGEYDNFGGPNVIRTTSGKMQMTQSNIGVVFDQAGCVGTSYAQISPFSILGVHFFSAGSFYKFVGPISTLPVLSRKEWNSGSCTEFGSPTNLTVAPIQSVSSDGLIDLTGAAGNGLFDNSQFYYKSE